MKKKLSVTHFLLYPKGDTMRIKLDIPLTVSEVISAVGGEGSCSGNEKIYYLTTDTRESEPGDLFFALDGNNSSGENYVTHKLCQRLHAVTVKSAENAITVSDTKAALLDLSSYYLGKLERLKHTVAITGSVGKTTTKEFVRVLASGSYITHTSPGNFNNEIGVPLTILSAPKNTEVLICEVGMNHTGEISKISKALSPNVAVITNIGTAHIGNLGSRENIAKAKLEILNGMSKGVLIVPKDEPLVLSYGNKSFSISDKSADYCVSRSEIYESGRFRANHLFNPQGEHFIACLAASFAVCRELSIDFKCLVSRISDISQNNTRQKITKVGEFYVFEDYYNASIESIEADFKLLASCEGYSMRSALLGDMLELGDMSEYIHKRVGELAAYYKLDKLYLFGKYGRYYREGAIFSGFDKSKIFLNEDRTNPSLTKQQILDNVSQNEIILFKGSRNMHLEKILDLFKENKQQ